MFWKADGVHGADWMTGSADGMNREPVGEDRQRRISTNNVPDEFFCGLTIGVASRNLLLWLTPKLSDERNAARELPAVTHVDRSLQCLVSQNSVGWKEGMTLRENSFSGSFGERE